MAFKFSKILLHCPSNVGVLLCLLTIGESTSDIKSSFTMQVSQEIALDLHIRNCFLAGFAEAHRSSKLIHVEKSNGKTKLANIARLSPFATRLR